MPFFQFPWRFMGPLAFVMALAGGLVFSVYAHRLGPRAMVWAELAVLSLCLLNALPQLGCYLPLNGEEQTLVADLGPERIKKLALPATVMNEYLPQDAANGVWSNLDPNSGVVLHSTRPAKVFASTVSGTQLSLVVEATVPTALVFRRWAYPSWRVYVDGDELQAGVDRNGLLMVEVPEGRHDVRIHLESPKIRGIGVALSLVALLAVLAMFISDRVSWTSRP